ncbi:hypothetical protein HYU92_00080 [Candidatus Curtissbacteria bacterium]|nr:hypothetical protein [Candidatus Curtissbacteria bacterium]
MRNWLLILLGVIIFVSASSGIYYLYQKRIRETDFSLPPLPKPQNGFPSAQESSATPSPGTILGTQPDTGSGPNSPGIILTSPQPDNFLSSPIFISGWTKIDSDKIEIKIKDQSNNILGKTTASSCSNFEVCPFATQLSFVKPQTSSGTIEVHSFLKAKTKYYTSTVVQFD